MKLLLKFLFLSFFVFSANSYALKNMKRCTLLPIVDNVDGAISYKVFSYLEKELQSSRWCSYRSNAELLNVFSSYREKLGEYLHKPEVLKTVAGKLSVGSLIKVDLEGKAEGIEAVLTVYGSSGDVKFYQNKTLVKSEDIEAINLSLRNWLQEYSKIIPYDGIVVGVLGDQVTIDVGRSRNLKVGQKFTIRKFVNYKKHPLLQSVVEWNSRLIGKGKVFNFSNSQAVGIVKIYKGELKINKGDWVIVNEEEEPIETKFTDKEIEANQFGKLGIGSVFIEAGDYSVKNSGSTSHKINGILMGVHLKVEGWITRNYFAIIEYGRKFGNLKKSTNNLSADSYGVVPSVLKVLAGYRFLPLRFFYGPRLDIYAGWGDYSYDVDLSSSEGFGSNSFSGLIGGVKVDMPFVKKLRGFARAEIIAVNKFNQKDNIFGSVGSTSSLQFELGVQYQWNPVMFIDGGIQMTNNKAKFENGSIRDLQYQDSTLRLGVSYLF